MSENEDKILSPLEIKLANLPTNPGIYQFKDKNGKIIYVGKAKNLRNRVKQYFTSKPVGPRLEKMISLIKDVEIINTDSEVESLILEMNLIKELKPRYNVNLKDDKSYPYIVITNELFPRVFPTRKRRNDGSKYFGPYTDVGTMKFSLKMLRDIFMIRNCNLHITQEAIDKKKFKVCLEYHIHKCEGPCEGLVSEQRYNEMIDEVEKVLNGKTTSLIKELNEKMKYASENMKFEEAAILRNKIESLQVYTERQKVVSEDMLDKDIFAYVKEENEACAMVLNIRDGKVIGKRHFYIDNLPASFAIDTQAGVDEISTMTGDDEILETVIFKYYSENNFIPDEIYLQSAGGELEDLEALNEWFRQKFDKKVEITIPQRGDKVKLVSMVKANAQYMLDELKLQRLKREFIPHSVTALKRDLRLTKLPRRIECFDISNIQGTDTVASMVDFYDGKPRKNDYRKFKIQTAINEVGKPDDFASMREVIYRRYRKNAPAYTSPQIDDEQSKEKETEVILPLPDMIVIDGGKGQLSSAVHVLNDIGLKNINIIGLAKRLEEVFLPEHTDAQSIPKTSSGLKLLQRIRDEAHRFAITFHRSLRDKRTLVSELEEIKGIGKKTASKLLTEFGSVDKIKEMIAANYDEFVKKAGKSVSEKLREWFKNK